MDTHYVRTDNGPLYETSVIKNTVTPDVLKYETIHSTTITKSHVFRTPRFLYTYVPHKITVVHYL